MAPFLCLRPSLLSGLALDVYTHAWTISPDSCSLSQPQSVGLYIFAFQKVQMAEFLMKVLVCFILTYKANPRNRTFHEDNLQKCRFNSVARTEPILFCSTLNMEVNGKKKAAAMEESSNKLGEEMKLLNSMGIVVVELCETWAPSERAHTDAVAWQPFRTTDGPGRRWVVGMS